MIGMRVAIFVLVAAGCALVACDSVGGGPKRLVINETVCLNTGFLRLDVGEKRRIVVDNKNPTPGLTQFTFRMPDFPIVITGEVPPQSTIGERTTTLIVITKPGEEKTVDIVPRETGSFVAHCSAIIGGRVIRTDVPIQIV
jgi:hypothetical protein